MIISKYTDKAVNKIQQFIMIKNSQETENRGNILNLIKSIPKKSIVNIYSNVKKECFLLPNIRNKSRTSNLARKQN